MSVVSCNLGVTKRHGILLNSIKSDGSLERMFEMNWE